MMQEIKIEIVKRAMGFLIKIADGESYIDRLENSYKNVLLIMLFLITLTFSISINYAQLYIYTNDADYLYRLLMERENRVTEELEKTIAFAREQFNMSQSLRKENYELIQTVDDLKKENELLHMKLNSKK